MIHFKYLVMNSPRSSSRAGSAAKEIDGVGSKERRRRLETRSDSIRNENVRPSTRWRESIELMNLSWSR
jgi:hypothetical protein